MAGGIAVANLYWAQPLLDFIAHDLRTSSATAGWLVTATQVGYAVGIVLIVPLGDVLNRRRLIPLMMLCTAVALTACALAPSILVLLLALAAVGVTTVSAQILVPLAGDLAAEVDRGRTVGIVFSGILSGILLSRTLSGLVAGEFGWRSIFAVGAVLAVVFAALLYRAIPTLAAEGPAVLPIADRVGRSSCGGRAHRALERCPGRPRIRAVHHVLDLAHLPAQRAAVPLLRHRHRSVRLGRSGRRPGRSAGGRLHDRGWSIPATGAAWGLAVVAFVIGLFAGRSVPLILITIVVLDIAVQSVQVLNSTRLFTLPAEVRSRVNTALIAGNFVGGAIGSALATVLWSADGWTAVMVAELTISCFALLVWTVGRRSALVPAASGAL